MQAGTLAQLGAKNGEKFIWVNNEDFGTFTILDDSDEFADQPCVKAESENYGIGLFKEEIFRRVLEGPIRTVTRREIVPGTYGRVGIAYHKNNRVGVYVIDHNSGMTAEELDNVAMIASQLAEALRDV